MKQVIERLDSIKYDLELIHPDSGFKKDLISRIRKQIDEAIAELQVRRWETLEQWEQRMGEKWKGAVYFNLFSKKDGHSAYIDGKYQTHTVEDALEIIDRLENKQHCHEYTVIVICANSDNGRPPDGWRR